MQRPKKVMGKGNMIAATERSCSYVARLLADAREIDADARKDERIASQQCKACFYGGRMGGAAMTTQPCGCCDEKIMYGSTNTDALCKPCATKHGLCRHCGGDIDLKASRRNWPEIVS